MTTLTQAESKESATDGQIRQITRVATDAAERTVREFSLTKRGAQRVHAKGDQLVRAIEETIKFVLEDLSCIDKFKSEEVESNFTYFSGYKPKSLHDQTNLLRELFPGLKVASPSLLMQAEEKKIPLPANAEGWFAIPNWKKCPKIFGATYSEALLAILSKLGETRGGAFCNHYNGRIDEQHLRQSAESEVFWNGLARAQGNPDILIAPAQFGLRHRGRSIRRAREIIEDSMGECGLGSFAAGCMLLIHPERLKNVNDLWIDLPGDEFSSDAGGDFLGAPTFAFGGDGKLQFVMRVIGGVGTHFGSGSVFVPQ